jgi:hypothetical protein
MIKGHYVAKLTLITVSKREIQERNKQENEAI